MKTPKDIEQLNEEKFETNEIQNIDLHGRRIVNASNSKDLTDYITRYDLLSHFSLL